jgi:hypothetical protein
MTLPLADFSYGEIHQEIQSLTSILKPLKHNPYLIFTESQFSMKPGIEDFIILILCCHKAWEVFTHLLCYRFSSIQSVLCFLSEYIVRIQIRGQTDCVGSQYDSF